MADALLEVWVQWPLHIHPFRRLISSSQQVQIANHSASPSVIHLPGSAIADPSMGSSAARKHPENVFEPKIVSKGTIQYLDRHHNERPAFLTNLTPGATGSDRIIGIHVDIEAELL
jgi:hypothetical protein